jgi:hypothetical protein
MDSINLEILIEWLTNGYMPTYLSIKKDNYVLSIKDSSLVIFRRKELGDFTDAEKNKIEMWLQPRLEMYDYVGSYSIEKNEIRINLKMQDK